jgi:dihydroorotase
MHDLLIRDGRVVDPGQGIDAVMDVAIDGGRIAALGSGLAAGGVREVLDAAGLIVAPGLVDLHTHVYAGVAPLGIEADPHCLARGVTTAVDAGSAGAATFGAFRKYVIDVAATRIKAMLHVASIGMARDDRSPHPVGELEDIRWARVDWAVDVARAHADVVVGIKVRLGEGQLGRDPENCREALRRTRQVADAVGKPAMIHIGTTPIPLDEILENLNSGDVVTHCYHGRREGILDGGGRVKRAVRRAAERGIGFDVGHGAGSFSFEVARRGLDQGFEPATISSDIHAWSVAGPAYDLATTATKFLHLGMPLEAVLRKVTEAPARAIGMAGQIGTLAVGAHADVSLLRLAEGEWPLTDTHGVTERSGRRIEAVKVVRAGKVYPCAPAAYQQHVHQEPRAVSLTPP